MAELAVHLADGVLGGLPVRQWVLTLPYRLRYVLAWDHRLCCGHQAADAHPSRQAQENVREHIAA